MSGSAPTFDRASCVAGIDVGTLSSPSYVAWLYGGEFTLDLYLPTPSVPLPGTPRRLPPVSRLALDVPQGLPVDGRARREADAGANTPTRVLPPDRDALARLKLYGGLVRAGVEIFWSIHQQGHARIAGLPAPDRSGPLVMETYPRYVIRRLWPTLQIPSKRKSPVEYVEVIWELLKASGYRCSGVVRPTVDQVDAMICSLAAEASTVSGALPPGTVGTPPQIDSTQQLLREGFIVSP